MSKSADILLVCGEPSGFVHLENIALELRNQTNNISISAMGYPSNHIDNLIVDIKDRASMGLTDILKNTRFYTKSLMKLKQYINFNKPKIAVLIDNFEFNALLLKCLFRNYCNIFYFIPPKVWSWGGFRSGILKRYCKRVYTIYPFEEKFLKKYGIDIRYVGNPFINKYLHIRESGNEKNANIIGLLPGSRRSEIIRHMPVLLRAVKIIRRRLSSIRFILGASSDIRGRIEEYVGDDDGIEITDGIIDVLNRAGLIIVASGTATFEVAVCGIPMIVIYRTSPLTYYAGRVLIRNKFIGLPNLIAGREIVPELIQGRMNEERIAKYVINLHNNKYLYESMHLELLSATEEMIGNTINPYENTVKDILEKVGLD